MLTQIIDFILHVDKYLNILIQNFGAFVYVLLFVIIFLETGFVITPFFPGDSLLFVAGTFAGVGTLNIYALLVILSLAAIIGDTVNYWLGSFFGEKLLARFVKNEYIERTKTFYKKHGKKTIILARFVPVIRTFAPFVAGIGKMNYLAFLSYNVIGGIVWVFLFTLAGYFFGGVPFVEENLTAIIFLIIIVSFIPVVLEYVRHRRSAHIKK